MGLLETAKTAVPAEPTRLALSRRVRGTAVVFGIVAAVVSVLGSWIPSLWGDEVTSILSAERPLPSLFRMLGNVDAVHGTYYLFLHFWIIPFGPSAFSVRFPSAIAVGVMASGVVVLATRLAKFRTGIIAGIVVVVLPRVTYMGEEARSYAISAACVVWLTVLLVELVRATDPPRRWWLLYGFGVALCAYVFLFSLLILVAHAVVIFSARRPELRRPWAMAAGVGVVISGPVIGYGIGERGQIEFLANRDATNPRTLIVTQWFGNDLLAALAWALVIATVVVGIVAWVRARRAGRYRPLFTDAAGHQPTLVPLAAVWLLASALLLLLANEIHPVYSSRYLSFAVPAAALLIGWLLARVTPAWIGWVLLAAIIGTSAITYVNERTPYAKNNSDWAEVAGFMQSHARPGDGVLFDEGTRPSRAMRLAMHGYPDAFSGLVDVAIRSPWYDTLNWHDSTYPLADVSSRLDGIHTVWLLEYRAAGYPADRYDRATLAKLGYTVVHISRQHTSDIIELTRD